MTSCGTHNGPRDHRKRGEPVCPDCAEAAAQYIREWRIRKEIEKDPQAALRRAVENATQARDRLRLVREIFQEVTGRSA